MTRSGRGVRDATGEIGTIKRTSSAEVIPVMLVPVGRGIGVIKFRVGRMRFPVTPK